MIIPALDSLAVTSNKNLKEWKPLSEWHMMRNALHVERVTAEAKIDD